MQLVFAEPYGVVYNCIKKIQNGRVCFARIAKVATPAFPFFF
jgi:hypothetical protein